MQFECSENVPIDLNGRLSWKSELRNQILSKDLDLSEAKCNFKRHFSEVRDCIHRLWQNRLSHKWRYPCVNVLSGCVLHYIPVHSPIIIPLCLFEIFTHDTTMANHVHGTSAIQECEWNPPNRLIWSENSLTSSIYKMVHALRQAKYDLIHLQSLQCKHMIVAFKMKNSGTWRCWTQWRFWLYWRYYMWCKWTSLLSYFHLVYILRIHGISLLFLCGYVAQGLLVFGTPYMHARTSWYSTGNGLIDRSFAAFLFCHLISLQVWLILS